MVGWSQYKSMQKVRNCRKVFAQLSRVLVFLSVKAASKRENIIEIVQTIHH